MTDPTQSELEALAPLVDRAHVAVAAERRLPPMETAKSLVNDALIDDVGAVLRDREERKLSDELDAALQDIEKRLDAEIRCRRLWQMVGTTSFLIGLLVGFAAGWGW